MARQSDVVLLRLGSFCPLVADQQCRWLVLRRHPQALPHQLLTVRLLRRVGVEVGHGVGRIGVEPSQTQAGGLVDAVGAAEDLH
ncbi:MAG: hypothetical protein COY42_17370 [Armatimonadetes bacterium CG_4_10_14_0_8_um_filter_66_14]|nr:MAG: hypothetical protein COY42_17370 [Armatimonadetes bacterium CG_4_10_14_0_8_um_filter_66_14]